MSSLPTPLTNLSPLLWRAPVAFATLWNGKSLTKIKVAIGTSLELLISHPLPLNHESAGLAYPWGWIKLLLWTAGWGKWCIGKHAPDPVPACCLPHPPSYFSFALLAHWEHTTRIRLFPPESTSNLPLFPASLTKSNCSNHGTGGKSRWYCNPISITLLSGKGLKQGSLHSFCCLVLRLASSSK